MSCVFMRIMRLGGVPPSGGFAAATEPVLTEPLVGAGTPCAGNRNYAHFRTSADFGRRRPKNLRSQYEGNFITICFKIKNKDSLFFNQGKDPRFWREK